MPPRNRDRHASPGTSPSSTPPSAGLTKRQRQALRIHRPPLPVPSTSPSAASVSVSPSMASPRESVAASPSAADLAPPDTYTPEMGTSPASAPSDVEGIRIRHISTSSLDADERERASPSKYPTPLPDDDDDEEPLRIAVPVSTREEEESAGVFEFQAEEREETKEEVYQRVERMEREEEEREVHERMRRKQEVMERMEREEEEREREVKQQMVPTGTLIDVQEEYEAEAPVASPTFETPVVAPAPPAVSQPKETSGDDKHKDENETDTAPRKPRRRRSPAPSASHPPVPAPSQHQHHAQAQSHLRAPEAPRQPPRTGLGTGVSALSHTLRTLQAVTSTATAYAHAYATSSGAHPHSNSISHSNSPYLYESGSGSGSGAHADSGGIRIRAQEREQEEETILAARWDEVVEWRGSTSTPPTRATPTPRTRRLLTLTYAAGVQVWDASVLGGVGEVVNLRIPLAASASASSNSSNTTSTASTNTPMTPAPRTSVDTLRAVDAPRSSAETLRALDSPLSSSSAEADTLREKEEMHGPILGAAILPPMPVARGSGSGNEREGNGEGQGLEMGILTSHALYIYALNTGRVVARYSFPSSFSSSSISTPSHTSAREGKDAYAYAYAYGGRGRDGDGDGRERGAGGGGNGDRGGGEGVEVGTPCAFEAAERVVVVTTHSPPALVVLARPSLRVLHVFPAAALAVPLPPLSPVSDAHRASFSSSYGNNAYPGTSPPYSNASTSPPHGINGTSPPSSTFHSTQTPAPAPSPISALHGRLLAFLAPPPSAPLPSPGAAPLASWGRTLGRFFSRSAPTASAIAASVFAGSPPLAASVAAVAGTAPPGGGGAGAWVRVVDLAPLLAGTKGRDRTSAGRDGGGVGPCDVHAFEAGRHAVGGLSFARDGTKLFVVRRDGLGASMWALRPSPPRHPHPADEALPAPAQAYTLRRGRTGAVVEAVAAAQDGRYVALATRRRTVHVFAVNPYGGRADVRSHLGARVRNAEAIAAVSANVGVSGANGNGNAEEEGPTEVHALVRMRLPPPPQTKQQQQAVEVEAAPPPAPLAVTFVPATTSGTGSGPLRSPASPSGAAASGVQDVLVFDPADGVLSLRRVTLALEAPHAAGLPISVSLPAARLSMSASPPAYAASYARGAGTNGVTGSGAESGPGELAGREAVVATWSLRRKRGWAEIRRAEMGEVNLADGPRVKEDWLAQAELSTFSSAPRVLPRAIYLSHQFAFYTLGEDYHALIRRYQFAIGGAKIDVRREVEVSAFSLGPASGGGEAFVEGYGSSSPRAIRRRSRASSSFDEPLASALAGAHYRDARPPPVLPMLPNGSPRSFRSSMPVRAVAGLGDGVAEGLGRLRREMRHQRQKQLARSPPAPRRKASAGGDDIEASVPLEFDEEDEDFAVPPRAGADDVFLRVHADREDDDALSATTSRNGEESVASISTPATSAHPLEDEERMELDLDAVEGEWNGWAAEDKLAVEEAERFDDISVVGFLDEEQAAMQAEAARRKGVAARTRKRRN